MAKGGDHHQKTMAERLRNLFLASIIDTDEWDQGKVYMFLGYLADLQESGPPQYHEHEV